MNHINFYNLKATIPVISLILINSLLYAQGNSHSLEIKHLLGVTALKLNNDLIEIDLVLRDNGYIIVSKDQNALIYKNKSGDIVNTDYYPNWESHITFLVTSDFHYYKKLRDEIVNNFELVESHFQFLDRYTCQVYKHDIALILVGFSENNAFLVGTLMKKEP